MRMAITSREITLLGAAIFAASVAAVSASAQDLGVNTSCLNGSVAGNDYAELSSNFRESIWDTKAGVQLVSDTTHLTIKVIDAFNNDACEQTADMNTRCSFRLNAGNEFTIKVSNEAFSARSGYRLCAF